MGDVVDPVRIVLISLITVQNLVVVCHTIWAYIGGLKNLGVMGPRIACSAC